MATNLETMLVVLDANVERMRRELKKGDKAIVNTQRTVKKNIDGIDRSFAQFGAGAKSLAAFFGVTLGIHAVKDTLLLADSIDILQDRVKDATREAGNFEEVWESLKDTSIDTGGAISENVSLYQRLAMRTDELGATSTQMLKLVDVVSKLGIVGGSSTSEIRNGTLQLAQGLGEGIFRAQEFNSVLENLPAVMSAVSSSMGMTVSELRKMVIEGKLLSKDVFDAILEQSGDIDDRFAAIPPRLTRSWDAFLTAISMRIDKINDKFSITEDLARSLDRMSAGVTPIEELTEKQVRDEISRINNTLFQLSLDLQAVGSRTLDPILDIIPGRLDEDIRLYQHRIDNLRKKRGELEGLLKPPSESEASKPFVPPITENYIIPEIKIDPKPIQEAEASLHAYNLAVNELEVDVLRSQGNVALSIRASADIQIEKWKEVAEKTPEFARQASEAILLINEKVAADIKALNDKVNKSAEQFANSMASAFASRGIDALLNGEIGGAVKGLAADFAEITLRLLILKPLAEGIFGALGGGGGVLGGIGSLFGFANGGTTSVPAMANERGSEELRGGKGIFMPIGGPASIVSAADSKRGTGTTVLNQNISFEQPMLPTMRAMMEAALPMYAEAAANIVMTKMGGRA